MVPGGRGGRQRNFATTPALAYFLLLGLGFMLLEIGFLHRFVLFLHHPLYTATTVLASFLVFAGAGSALAQAATSGRVNPKIARAAIGLVLALTLVGLLLLPWLAEAIVGEAAWLRYLLAVALVAPLALAMGMPFPLGLIALQRQAPSLLPWAWAANGCASVVGAVLATVLAIQWGFTAVMLLALACYAGAGLLFPCLAGTVDRPKAAAG